MSEPPATAAQISSQFFKHLPKDAEGHALLGGVPLRALLEKTVLGPVFKGTLPRLGTEVSVTCLSPALAAQFPKLAEEFLAEARKVAQLSTPHHMRVLDVDAEGGVSFLVEELPAGQSAAASLAERQSAGGASAGLGLELDEALAIATAAARGLAAAHAASLSHLDLRPEHLFIPQPRADGEPDFAGAKIRKLGLTRLRAAAAQAGGTPRPLGTPGYMAPELALLGQTAGPAADTFSLGAVLYFLLTGRPPFEGDDVGKVIFKTAHEEPPPLKDLRPELPAAVSQFIGRCLRKDPAQRFANGAELLKGLEALALEARRAPPRARAARAQGAPGSTKPAPASATSSGQERMARAAASTSAAARPAAAPAAPARESGAQAGRTRPVRDPAAPAGPSPARKKPGLLASMALGALGFLVLFGLVWVIALRERKAPDAHAAPDKPGAPARPATGGGSSNPALEAAARQKSLLERYDAEAARSGDAFAKLEGQLAEMEALYTGQPAWAEALDGRRVALNAQKEALAKKLAESLGESAMALAEAGNLKGALSELERFPPALLETHAALRLHYFRRRVQDLSEGAFARADQQAQERMKASDFRGALAVFDGLSAPMWSAQVELRRREIRDAQARGLNPSVNQEVSLTPAQAYYRADIYVALPEMAMNFDAAWRLALQGGDAAQVLEARLKEYPRSAVYYYTVALAYANTGRMEPAREYQSHARRHARAHPAFQSRLLALDIRLLLANLADPQALKSALAKAEEAVRLDEQDPDAHFVRGAVILALANLVDKADPGRKALMAAGIAALRQAQRLDNAYPRLRDELGDAPEEVKPSEYMYQGTGQNPHLRSVVMVLGRNDFGGGLGTGFVVKSGPEGTFVVTNHHVVQDMKSFEVRYQVEEEKTLKRKSAQSVKLLATDPAHDLAVLQISAPETLPVLPLRKTTAGLAVPMKLTLIGHPHGEDFTVVSGELANLNRVLDGKRFLQLNANITHGNSGGPVLDEQGCVIGVTMAIREDIPGYSLAILSEHVRDLCAKVGVKLELR